MREQDTAEIEADINRCCCNVPRTRKQDTAEIETDINRCCCNAPRTREQDMAENSDRHQSVLLQCSEDEKAGYGRN